MPPPIVPKHELVEVDLQLRLADAVVRADQPLLEVADGAVSQGRRGGHPPVQGAPDRLRAGDVPDVGGLETVETLQAVAIDRCPRRDMLHDEREHRRLFEVRDHGHADPTRPITASFHRHQHNRGFPPFELAKPACGAPKMIRARLLNSDVQWTGVFVLWRIVPAVSDT